MNKPNAPILIIGAGLGGLTAALALLRRGFDVEIYEQSGRLGEVGAGVQIGPNGTKVLIDLGIERELSKVAFRPTAKIIRIWNTGETFPALDLSGRDATKFGAPYLTLHRADLYNALLAGVRNEKPDAIHLGFRCASIAQDGKGVTAFFENGEKATGAALIGADGVHSSVRASLFGPDRPTYTGLMSWRGVIPMERLPESLHQPVGVNWVGPNGHVVHYPLRGGEIMNVNAVVEHEKWEVESWTMAGTTEECLNDFKGWHEEVHALMRAIDRPLKWAFLYRKPLDKWAVGRATLLGDACHSMVPFLAQGASIAIEDGLVLARAFQRYPQDIEQALKAYEAARFERAYKVVRGSADNIQRFHNPALADPKTAVDYVRRSWGERQVTGQSLDWIFSYDAATVPV